MYLKKLKVHGFKSFADPSTVHFVEGITSIVGPNGCGKSNIADAFRWVLGEQSAKSLRGTRMPDVIFAGTSSRKPLGFAEVSLTLSDVQDRLPIDYEEVTITRRLHRSGDSEYLINNHSVRLKDVHSLFLDSGIGRSAFSIFEQGKIDQVINLSPYERRYLFEEAAGILRFLQRKREALRKLADTQGNLDRLQDLLQEVTRQVEVLGKQAEQARQYKGKKEQLEELQESVLYAKWSRVQEIGQALAKQHTEQREQLATVQALVERRRGQIKSERVKLEEVEKELTAVREEVIKVKAAQEHATQDRRRFRERMQEAVTNQKRWERELAELRTSSLARRNEMQTSEAKAVDAQKVLEQRLQVFIQSQEEAANAEQVLSQHQLKVQQAHAQQLKAVQEEGRLSTVLQRDSARLEQAQAREKGLAQRFHQQEQAQRQAQSQLTHKQKAAEAAEQQREQVSLQLEKLKAQRVQLDEEVQYQETEARGVERELAELQTRQKLLKQLRDQGEGLSRATQHLLEASRSQQSVISGLLRPLYELLRPKSGCEAMVSTALASYAHTLVVHAREDLQRVLDYATQKELTGYSLLCLELLTEPSLEEEFAEKSVLQGAVQRDTLARHMLGDILHIVEPKEALDWAQRLKHVAVTCGDGVHIDRSRVVSKADTGSSNVFSREAELADLEERGRAQQTELKKKQAALSDCQRRRAEVKKLQEEQQQMLNQMQMALTEANMEVKQAQRELQRLTHEFETTQSAQRKVEHEVQQLQQSVGKLQQDLSAIQEYATEEQQTLQALQEQQKQFSTQLEVKKQEYRRAQTEHSKASEEHHKIAHTLSLLSVKEQESRAQIQRLENDIQTVKALQLRLEEEEKECDFGLSNAEERLQQLSSTKEQQEQRSAQQRKLLLQLENELDDAAREVQKREQNTHELAVKKAQQDSLCQALSDEYYDLVQVRPGDPEYSFPTLETSLSEAERTLRGLKQSFAKLGDVNLTSIEEHEVQKERMQQLNIQLDDLHASREQLKEVITELDEQSRTLFVTTFDTIRRKFKEIFQILFRGGEADLTLTEGEDVLEAGIEIAAKPPGKQMRSIHLMSGGEKCLTALALLFALFEVKPAPFCILDEIDAPLDDANVDRFVGMLRHFSDRCQFIVITHNKGTMAIADVLVGVSMQEKGVSRILSLDFAKRDMALGVL